MLWKIAAIGYVHECCRESNTIQSIYHLVGGRCDQTTRVLNERRMSLSAALRLIRRSGEQRSAATSEHIDITQSKRSENTHLPERSLNIRRTKKKWSLQLSRSRKRSKQSSSSSAISHFSGAEIASEKEAMDKEASQRREYLIFQSVPLFIETQRSLIHLRR